MRNAVRRGVRTGERRSLLHAVYGKSAAGEEDLLALFRNLREAIGEERFQELRKELREASTKLSLTFP